MESDSGQRVLLAAATVRDGEITRALLAAEGVECVVCLDLPRLIAELDQGVGVIVLTEEAFGAEGMSQLMGQLARQPPWSDIPVVMLMRGDRTAPAAAGILRSLTNVTLLERPAPTRSVVSAVQAAMRARQRQYQIREQFQAIREGRQRFEAMANFIPQLAWMAKPDGWIFWYNRRWYDYTGTTPAQMEGWGWRGVQHPDELEKVLAQWNASLQRGEPFDMTFPLRGADGVFRPFLTRAVPFRDERDQIVLWFGTNTDVTDQLRLMQERDEFLASERAARATAEQAGRLKDEFLATLSHELRTPLNAILGWSQLLFRRNRENAEILEGLSVIERNARLQAQLIEDLLDMSRIISGKLRIDVQTVDLAEITNAAIETVRPAAEAKEIVLKKVLATPRGQVRGDPGRLQQIVWNLLSNAIKFTPRGGRVEVALSQVNCHLELTVTDTGIGVKPEFLPHVFDRFRQADASTTRKHGGLGLGLAIVKNLVELHGGKVQAQSAGEGQGSTFAVEIPLMAAHSHAPPAAAGGSTGPAVRPARAQTDCEDDLLRGVVVLVVDDDADARDVISRMLEECKAKVVVASTGEEGREILMRQRPWVIVSDIGMPEEDGYEFIRKVRLMPEDQGGKTPAAALTAFARSEDRARALRAGYQSHVAKPIEAVELVAVIASLVGRTGYKAAAS